MEALADKDSSECSNDGDGGIGGGRGDNYAPEGASSTAEAVVV